MYRGRAPSPATIIAVPTFDDARRIALGLPETAERPCWGTPAFYVRTRFFARLLEDDERLVVKCSHEERRALAAERPETFGWTAHYDKHEFVLVTLAVVEPVELREVLVEAWRMVAPKTLLRAYDAS
jgi:hypothetical protein